jgi:hypothetical protein
MRKFFLCISAVFALVVSQAEFSLANNNAKKTSIVESPQERAARLFAKSFDGKTTWGKLFSRTSPEAELPVAKIKFKALWDKKLPLALHVGESVFLVNEKKETSPAFTFFENSGKVGVRLRGVDITPDPKETFTTWWDRMEAAVNGEPAPIETSSLDRALEFIFPAAYAQSQVSFGWLSEGNKIHAAGATFSRALLGFLNGQLSRADQDRIRREIREATTGGATSASFNNLRASALRAITDTSQVECFEEEGKQFRGMAMQIQLDGRPINVRSEATDQFTLANINFRQSEDSEPRSTIHFNDLTGSYSVQNRGSPTTPAATVNITDYANAFLPAPAIVELPREIRSAVHKFDRCLYQEKSFNTARTMFNLFLGRDEDQRFAMDRSPRNALIANIQSAMGCNLSSRTTGFGNCEESYKAYCRNFIDEVIKPDYRADSREGFRPPAQGFPRVQNRESFVFEQGVVTAQTFFRQNEPRALFSPPSRICGVPIYESRLLDARTDEDAKRILDQSPACANALSQDFAAYNSGSRGENLIAEAQLIAFRQARQRNSDLENERYRSYFSVSNITALTACCRLDECQEAIRAEMAVRRSRPSRAGTPPATERAE